MNKIIKSLIVFIFVLVGFNVTSANITNADSSTGNGYNNVITDKLLNLTAYKSSNGQVVMKWSKYTKDNFKYYKVVKSTSNTNPAYPDDGHIKYSSDINFTNYTDVRINSKTTYYRLCVITTDMNRYCSNIVKIEGVADSGNDMQICTMEYAPVCGYKNGYFKTYSNKCILQGSNADFKYSGECKKTPDSTPDIKEKICTIEYAPVCGEQKVQCIKAPCYPLKKTFSNKCSLENSGAKYLYAGECKNKSNLSSDIKSKLDKIMDGYLNKLDSLKITDDFKIQKINHIQGKLKELFVIKPKLGDMIVYIIDILEDAKSKYSNGINDIENIFNL